jgi:hypothetical protein
VREEENQGQDQLRRQVEAHYRITQERIKQIERAHRRPSLFQKASAVLAQWKLAGSVMLILVVAYCAWVLLKYLNG